MSGNLDFQFKTDLLQEHLNVLTNALQLFVWFGLKDYKSILRSIKPIKEENTFSLSEFHINIIDKEIRKQEGSILLFENHVEIENTKMRFQDAYKLLNHIKSLQPGVHIFNTLDLGLCNSCSEIYSRFGTRQYQYALECIDVDNHFNDEQLYFCISYIGKQMLSNLIRSAELNKTPVYEENREYGIYQEFIDIEYKIAWEIYQVFRHSIAWSIIPPNDNKYLRGVQYDTPLSCTDIPLPKCVLMKERG